MSRVIDGENHVVNAEGYLMPVRKGQQPPDLRHFEAPPP